MEKMQLKIDKCLDMFFEENEKGTEIYNAVLDLTTESVKKNPDYLFVIDETDFVIKYLFTSSTGNITFHKIKNSTRMIIFENFTKKINNEYAKRVTTIRNNNSDEIFTIDYEVFNGYKPYEITTYKIDKNFKNYSEKVLQKTR